MAITLTGAGGLFTRLGKLFYVLSILNAWRGTTLPTEVEDAIETLDGDLDAVRNTLVPGMLAAETGAQNSFSSLTSAIRAAAEKLLVKMVNDDNPLVDAGLEASLRELVRQIETQDYYVTPNVVAMATTETNLVGTGQLGYSLKDEFGRGLQNLLAEDLEISVSDTTTAAAERLRVRGEAAQNDRLHWNYPDGSGADKTFTCIDAASSTANLVANGAFENWTGANLDSFAAIVGAYGTDWVKETTTVYKGTNGLKLVGDGATLAQIRQDITSKVSANRQYLLNFWRRRGASAIAAGVLTVDLYDGSAVINDNAGNANTTTFDLTALTTTFARSLVDFRIPEPKPTTIYLRLRLSTALTNTREAFFDQLAMAQCEQLYSGGPFLGMFSGAANYNLQDYTGGGATQNRVHKYTASNNLAGSWQHYFDRVFEMRRLGLILRTSGANLINNNLIS